MNKDLSFTVDLNPISLREERRRTGRYVAVAMAICVTVLGLYQAIVQHTPVVAGLFAPAIIMFLYVFWVLYTAHKAPKPPPLDDDDDVDIELAAVPAVGSTELTVNPIQSTSFATPKDVNIKADVLLEKFSRNKLNRTYSIA